MAVVVADAFVEADMVDYVSEAWVHGQAYYTVRIVPVGAEAAGVPVVDEMVAYLAGEQGSVAVEEGAARPVRQRKLGLWYRRAP